MSVVVSRHRDRVVLEEGDRFVKEFAGARARDRELERLRWLEAAGVRGPEVLEASERRIVTARLPGEPLDALVRTRWATMPRAERDRLLRLVAGACRRLRDAGLAWPDLVTYHLWIAGGEVRALDPARLRRGKLDLSALHWSAEEPTVSRADRLRFWRAYAGDAPPPRLRAIGHRGRFRPYRWVLQRVETRPCPPFHRFVNAVGAPFASADEVVAHPRFRVRRELSLRLNGHIDDWVVKITTDAAEARREWENHRVLMAAGFRVPQPAVGGVLADGRGLFSTVRLQGLRPMDDVWATLDRRRAVLAAADLARRLHACGLVHRDFYLCHLFVAPGGGGEITLLDLARLTRGTSRRLRVKDLAAFVTSARGLCSRTDLWRGLLRYGGGKALARAVWRKAARMERHVPRNVQDGSHVPHVPCTSA
ncbi:MAG: lipopolysaccharide kinase InaA family protein [Planctomycetota bacterium]